MLAMINGRICQVLKSEEYSDGFVKIDAVTGITTSMATAGKRPGAKWRPHPNGDRRKWISHENVIERDMLIQEDALLGEEWPIGFEKYGSSRSILMEAVRPVMQRAVSAGGARARRVMPDVRREVVMMGLKREGLPFPTEEEFQDVLSEAWESLTPRRRKPSASGGRVIVKKAKEDEKPPEGIVLRDDERWSSLMGSPVPNSPEGDLMEQAYKVGWPEAMMAGAGARKRGDAGYTLSYMVKKKYSAEKYGTPESHGLATQDDAPPPVEPTVSTEELLSITGSDDTDSVKSSKIVEAAVKVIEAADAIQEIADDVTPKVKVAKATKSKPEPKKKASAKSTPPNVKADAVVGDDFE